MRGLTPYAWRSLVARPLRSILSILGVAIGVAVLVSALAVSAGLDQSIDRTVTSIIGRADLRVAAFAEAGLSSDTVTALDAVPGVAVTAPAIERRSFLGAVSGRPASTTPVTLLGVDPEQEPRVRDLELASGAPLTSTDENVALVTERLAAEDGLALGGELTIFGAGAPLHLRIVGILTGEGPALGSSGRTVLLPLATVARLGQAEDVAPGTTLTGITRVDVVLAAGADAETVIASIEQALVFEPYVLSSPKDVATSLRASTADVRSTMALLAAITLFAAAFLILNTLAMTVVERIRELGLLRAAGAGRAQVVRFVVAQALALGTAGSLLGLVLGAGLSILTASWLRAATPVTLDGPMLTPGVLLAGLGAGIGITVIAALEPARRASRVSPVTALRIRSDPAAAVRGRTGWLVVVVGLVGLLSIGLLPSGSAGLGGPLRTIAVYGILLFAVLLTPVLLGPLGRVVGLPFGAVMRLEERLARAAIQRDRGRTTLTVGTLVVGLAMVVALGAVAENARVVATGWLADVIPGDELVTAIAPEPIGAGSVEDDLLAIDGVKAVTPIAAFDLAFAGTRLEAVAIRGADFDADGRLVFTAGDRTKALAALDAGGSVLLPRARAEHMHVGVGDSIAVATADGLVELEVAGVIERSFPGRTGEAALVGWGDAVDRFKVLGADGFVVRFMPGREAAAGAAVEELAAQRALTASPVSRIEGAASDALDRVFGLLDLLALASVVIAALGIVNTLSMDTLERVRELGMLRAVGMSRRQVWRSVFVEAGILGAVGASVGVLAGLVIGIFLVVTAGSPVGDLRIPWPTIGLSLVLGIALAMLAAAQPARLAGQRSIVSTVRGD